jgi:tetratricopeptide (TPR) repeat protein
LISQTKGNLEEAHYLFDQALTGYQELGDRHGEAITLLNIARLYELKGEQEQAEIFFRKAYKLSETFGFNDQLHRLEKLYAGKVNDIALAKIE